MNVMIKRERIHSNIHEIKIKEGSCCYQDHHEFEILRPRGPERVEWAILRVFQRAFSCSLP